MATKRRTIATQEQDNRKELMWCIEMAQIMVLRRMFDARWTDAEIAEVYRKTLADCAELLTANNYLPIGDVVRAVFSHYEHKGGELASSAGWTDSQIADMYTDYIARHGTKHPERGISEEQFRVRLAEFEKRIDPWITGEGSKESAVRQWCKAVGVPISRGRGSFSAMFAVVDAIHPVT